MMSNSMSRATLIGLSIIAGVVFVIINLDKKSDYDEFKSSEFERGSMYSIDYHHTYGEYPSMYMREKTYFRNPIDSTLLPSMIPLDSASRVDDFDSLRYFLISYSFTSKDRSKTDIGYFSQRSVDFPKYKEIQSYVYSTLSTHKKEYQSVIITSIFEFNNREDYDQFNIKK